MTSRDFIVLFKPDTAPLQVRGEIDQTDRTTDWRKPMHASFRLCGLSLVAFAAMALIPRGSNSYAQFESTEVDNRYTEFEALLDSLATANASLLLKGHPFRDSLREQQVAFQNRTAVNPESFRKENTTPSAPRNASDAVRPTHKTLA